MVRNKNIEKAMIEVERAEGLEQLKEGILAVFKEIEREIDGLKDEIKELWKG